MSISIDQVWGWAEDILQCPTTGERLELRDDRLVQPDGTETARIDQGIIRFPIQSPDDGIAFYRTVGGSHFHERAAVPFAMSALDTPVYHVLIDEILPSDPRTITVDIGGGDGRNASYCLSRGCQRLVVVDAVAEALLRFRQRVAERHPDWLDRLLLIEADARALPLRSAAAMSIIAIETLCYLNEDYEIGLKECIRLMSPLGKILISERDYEGGLVLRLLYHGLNGLLELADNRSLQDGTPDSLVRSRCFTAAELVHICGANGLRTLQVCGTSLLPLLLGYLNGRGLLGPNDRTRLGELAEFLLRLSREGTMRRCNILIAERST